MLVILTPIERETLQVFLHISQMLNVSTFGNTADIYAIVHLVPHACQHITVDGHTCYYCLLAANQGNYARQLFFKTTWKVSLSIGVRITMISCVIYSLLIFKMVHGLSPLFWTHTDTCKAKQKCKLFPELAITYYSRNFAGRVEHEVLL
jgi:hypothetical protein